MTFLDFRKQYRDKYLDRCRTEAGMDPDLAAGIEYIVFKVTGVNPLTIEDQMKELAKEVNEAIITKEETDERKQRTRRKKGK